MQGTLERSTRWGVKARLALLLVGLTWLLAACGGDEKPVTGSSAVAPTAEPPAVAAATAAAPAAPAAAAAPQKLLKLDPVSGPIGTPFAITGVDLPAGRQVELVWMTADGSYEMKAGPEN